MMPRPQKIRRLVCARIYGGLLVGATWVHDPEWPERTVHFYVGFWTVTVRWKVRVSHSSTEGRP